MKLAKEVPLMAGNCEMRWACDGGAERVQC
jgi:hypothetical protein